MFASLAFALAAAAAACTPIAGENDLLSNARTRYVIVGEIHGTVEAPALFGDLACAAGSRRRPVVVAIEATEAEQGAIDQFIASDGGEAARNAFLKSAIWSVKDGRGSSAIFNLFERLRTYKQSGRIAEVVAIEPVVPPVDGVPPRQSVTEAAMAERLRAAGERAPGALVLALVGSVHASKLRLKAGSADLLTAAASLPPEETVGLLVTTGGTAWNCQGPTECGLNKWQGTAPRRRGILFASAPRPDSGAVMGLPMFDGMIDLGVPATASAPAR